MATSVTSREILEDGLNRLRDAIIKRSTDAGQKATGQSYGRIVVQNVTDVHGELAGPTWLSVWEDGRKPGKVPEGFTEVIMEWAAAKGISFASSDPVTFERWARGVAWSIRRKGTKLYQSGQQVDIFKTPIADFEEWLVGQLKVFYTANIADDLRNAWQK